MNKPWLGYLSSVLLLFAGVFMIVAGKPVLGVVFMVMAVLGLVLKIYMNKNQNK